MIIMQKICVVLDGRKSDRKLKYSDTFRDTFRKALGNEKTYGISGHFIWRRTNPDGTTQDIALSQDHTPASVFMNAQVTETITWKKAVVLKLFV